MGVHQNIGFTKFPRQGDFLDRNVNVYFNYNLAQAIKGKIVRDDMDEPGLTIIWLSDGRYVLATECQYQLECDNA